MRLTPEVRFSTLVPRGNSVKNVLRLKRPARYIYGTAEAVPFDKAFLRSRRPWRYVFHLFCSMVKTRAGPGDAR